MQDWAFRLGRTNYWIQPTFRVTPFASFTLYLFTKGSGIGFHFEIVMVFGIISKFKIIMLQCQLFLILLYAINWILIMNVLILTSLFEELSKFSLVMKSLLVKLLIYLVLDRMKRTSTWWTCWTVCGVYFMKIMNKMLKKLEHGIQYGSYQSSNILSEKSPSTGLNRQLPQPPELHS